MVAAAAPPWRSTGSSTPSSTRATRARRRASCRRASCAAARWSPSPSSRSAVLVLAAFNLSPPCRYLWPIVGRGVRASTRTPSGSRRSATTRLGLTDGLAPAAAWVAVSGIARPGAPVLLFLAVGLWVGGFDVIYGVLRRRVRPPRGHPLDRRRAAASAARWRPPPPRTPSRSRCSSWSASPCGSRIVYYVGMMLVGGAAAVVARGHRAAGPLTGGHGFHDRERPCGDRVSRGGLGGGPGVLAKLLPRSRPTRAVRPSPVGVARRACRSGPQWGRRIHLWAPIDVE